MDIPLNASKAKASKLTGVASIANSISFSSSDYSLTVSRSWLVVVSHAAQHTCVRLRLIDWARACLVQSETTERVAAVTRRCDGGVPESSAHHPAPRRRGTAGPEGSVETLCSAGRRWSSTRRRRHGPTGRHVVRGRRATVPRVQLQPADRRARPGASSCSPEEDPIQVKSLSSTSKI